MGAAPMRGASRPVPPIPAETSFRMLQISVGGRSHIGVREGPPAILWWRQRSRSRAQAVSYARFMLVTCSSWLCSVLTKPGRSCVSQYAFRMVSTCWFKERWCRESLAISRSRGPMQFQVRVLRIWFQSLVAAYVALSWSEIVAEASAFRAT